MRIPAIMYKEFKEYLLKPGSISWGVVFPLVFTFAFIVRFGDIDHLAPGLISISVLFATTSFVSSSIIFERRLRTFERLLLAPLREYEIIIAKALVGTVFGFFVGVITLLSLIKFMVYPIESVPLTLTLITLGSFAFSLFGIWLGLYVRNPINVMTWLNILRLPMMFTSGAIESLTLFPAWFLAIGLLTPLTYLVEGLRVAILNYYELFPLGDSLLGLTVFSLLMLLLSIKALKKLY